jgi:hypothetical protein
MRSVLLSLVAVSVAAAAECDRACLAGFVTRYLDAMVAHDPTARPASANVRFTENGQPMRLGQGLWKEASRVRPYRLDILDAREGITASQVLVEEAGSPVLLVVRLKVAGGTITEAETVVTRSRKEGAIFSFDALQTPRKEMPFMPDRSLTLSPTCPVCPFGSVCEIPPGTLQSACVYPALPPCQEGYRLCDGVCWPLTRSCPIL